MIKITEEENALLFACLDEGSAASILYVRAFLIEKKMKPIEWLWDNCQALFVLKRGKEGMLIDPQVENYKKVWEPTFTGEAEGRVLRRWWIWIESVFRSPDDQCGIRIHNDGYGCWDFELAPVNE